MLSGVYVDDGHSLASSQRELDGSSGQIRREGVRGVVGERVAPPLDHVTGVRELHVVDQ
jgi:hypothetical protein